MELFRTYEGVSADGLVHTKSITGLQLFIANRVNTPPDLDLRTLFMQSLRRRFTCSMHVGLGRIDEEDLAEFFTHSPADPCVEVRIGLDVLGFEDLTVPQARWFPQPVTPYLGADPAEFVDLFQTDAIALYISPIGDAEAAMQTLFAAPFIDDQHFVSEVTRHYEILVMTGYDGFYVNAYTRNPANFEMLIESFAEVEQHIRESDWFKQNAARLELPGPDESAEDSLLLPEFIRGPLSPYGQSAATTPTSDSAKPPQHGS